MLKKTRGIVLNHIKFKESSIIARIFTRELGVQSYIVNSVRGSGKRFKTKIAFFQPLTLLDLVVYYRKPVEGSADSLRRISELKCSEPYESIPNDIFKSGIALFLSELLNKVIQEEETNRELYDFISKALLILDHTPKGYASFHLIFMIQLSRYLGFQPTDAREMYSQLEGWLKSADHLQERINMVDQFMAAGFRGMQGNNPEIRRSVLEDVLTFYRLHVESIGELKSMSVLRAVMH